MNDIRKALESKNFDEQSMQMIETFVREFEDLFGKYVSKDEILKRINNNLNKITFCELEKENTFGTYDGEEKEIQLKQIDLSNNEVLETLKSVFFHEMIHCITRDNERGVTCFSVELEGEDFDDISLVTCHGLTEGFTQFVTNIRDRKYSSNLQFVAYPILAEQIENIVELIGEEKFLDIAFNRPEEIGGALGFEEGESFFANDLYEAFDDIWFEENEIYFSKQRQNEKEGRILSALFGKGYTKSKTLKRAKNTIIESLNRLLLKREINTVEELGKAYEKICVYADQLNTDMNFSFVQDLLSNVEILQSKGVTMEEILSGCNEDLRKIVASDQLTKEFCSMDIEEKIRRLADPDFEEKLYEIGIYEVIFYDDFLAQMSYSIMPTDSKERSATLFTTLKNGLAKRIIERGYNIEQLALEFVDFKQIYEINMFNLYSYAGERMYLGTYCEYDCIPYEVSLCGEQEREEIAQKYPELMERMLLKIDKDIIVAYNGDDEYTLIMDGEKIPSENIEYCPSELERLEQRLDKSLARYQKLKVLGVSEFILRDEGREIDEIKERIEKIKGKAKILHEDIEENIADISLEDLEKIIFDMTNSSENEKSFEEGMDYDE